MIRILLVYLLLLAVSVETCLAQEGRDEDSKKKESFEEAEPNIEANDLTPLQADSISANSAPFNLEDALFKSATISSTIAAIELSLASTPLNEELLGLASELYGIEADYASLSSTTAQMNNLGMYTTHRSYYSLLHDQMDSKEILITNGESDTRPLLMLGAASKGSYELLRMDWLDDTRLRPSLEHRGYVLPPAGINDAQQIKQFYQLNPQLRIVLSPTLNHQTLLSLQNELTTNGLVFSLKERKGKSNERIYSSLKSSLNTLSDPELKRSGMNYLPMLAEVWIHFKNQRDITRQSEVETLIRKILTANERLDLLPLLTGE